ncbi:MAG: membrane protein insertase YidC [Acidimicrobiaceae bacterium]|nr:membrane protein insertase YidC [Acidimicrobiia bacterium]MCY4492490.1 membrane protein insertase YidC [Acidimicrobiaceae bacterium]
MFDVIFDLIGQVLAFCYELWPSYGMAVAGLTLVVMVVVTPLTLKSTKSMLQMQRYQPELKAIQNRNRGDRQKLNEEMMAFQQEHGISMFGGCLPLLVQAPLFLVLFRVVQGLTSRATDFGNQIGWASGRSASGLTTLDGTVLLDGTVFGSRDRPFEPQNLPESSSLYTRLAGGDGVSFEQRPTEMVSWGMDLSRSAQEVISESLISAFPYVLLILIVLVSSIFQQRQIQSRSGSAMTPQTQMLMKIMPYLLPVFSFTMPAALVVYFVVSNLYRIGQQAYITRSLYRGEDSPGALLAKKREEVKGEEADHAASGGRTTPKKGVPTPKRDGSYANKKAKKPAARQSAASRSRSRGRGQPDGKGTRAKGSDKPATNGSRAKGSDKAATNGSRSARTGAGRTGNAPSRHHRGSGGSGRTTERGSPQHKKRKK